jgi:hypothetical protein
MRMLGRAIAVLLVGGIGALAAVLTLYLMMVARMPDLQWWHTTRLSGEFDLDDHQVDFDRYLAIENALFDELGSLNRAHAHQSANTTAMRGSVYNRFLPGSPSNPASQSHDWNHTFVLERVDPVGAALLLHGLSDSPYSLRSVAERLHAEGFFVVGLRIPGHGTLPGELLHAT